MRQAKKNAVFLYRTDILRIFAENSNFMKAKNLKVNNDSFSLVKERQEKIIATLREMGRYTDDLEYQTYLAAVCHVMVQQTLANIVENNPSGVISEKSREGNERISADPRQKQLLDYMTLEDKLLKSLGMNTAGKVRETESNGFKEMMAIMAEDE